MPFTPDALHNAICDEKAALATFSALEQREEPLGESNELNRAIRTKDPLECHFMMK